METILRLFLTLGADELMDNTSVAFYNATPYSKTTDVKFGIAGSVPYVTAEENYFLLDGSFRFLPSSGYEDVHVGYVGKAISDALGKGLTGQQILLTFPAQRNVSAITIRGFAATDDYCNDVTVEYFRTGAIVATQRFYPNNVTYTMKKDVATVDAVRLTLNGTSKPYRRARVTSIVMDDVAEVRGDMIKAASVTKRESPLGTELPYSTFDASMIAKDSTFDVTDSASLLNQMQARLAVDVLFDDGLQVWRLGRFYLDDDGWKSKSAYEMSISGKDVIGTSDDITYYGDFWSTDAANWIIVRHMLLKNPDIKSVTLGDLPAGTTRGFAEKGTVRDGLKQSLFSTGARVEIDPQNNATIQEQQVSKIFSATPEIEISSAQKLLGTQEITKNQPATRLEVMTHNYRYQATLIQLYKGTLPAGTQKVFFDRPAQVTASGVTGATLVNSYPGYVEITVPAQGEVTISGYEYVDNLVQASMDIASDARQPNVVTIEDATLISPDSVGSVLYRMNTFYVARYKVRCKTLWVSFPYVGRIVSVELENKKKLIGVVEEVNMDLAGGGICEYTVTGILQDSGATGSKAIPIGSQGTITPGAFQYPTSTPQNFTVQLLPGYVGECSIVITINGVATEYREVSSVQFTLNSTTRLTDVAVSFAPVTKKTITVGTGTTVTPAAFKYPWIAPQTFTAVNATTAPWKYYIKITQDGVATQYDITEKPFVLENTTASTSVAIERVEKSSKTITLDYDSSQWSFNPYGSVPKFWYPVSGTQTLNAQILKYNPGATHGYDNTRATYEWFVDGVSTLKHVSVSSSALDLSSAASSTVVMLKIYDVTVSGGGGSGGGTGGYTPWKAMTRGNYVMRDQPSPSGGFVASLGYNTEITITAQNSNKDWFYGTIIASAYPNTVGLSGWVNIDGIQNPGSNPN